jgi:sialic acid synthase SpsE
MGNNFLGDVNLAKEYITVAKECGCKVVKGQAFEARDVIKFGSMDPEFYIKCQLPYEEYKELIDFGLDIGVTVFFSIFSPHYNRLIYDQALTKISGGQSSQMAEEQILQSDSDRVIISIREQAVTPLVKNAHLLHVSKYMTDAPALERIKYMSDISNRPVGYSDHTVGLGACEIAIKEYGAHIIEKHFTLTRDIIFKGKRFRDAVHAADPKQLEQLCKMEVVA